MRKLKTTPILVGFLALFSRPAISQVYNLNTGTSAVGSNDPIWTVDLPGGGTTFVPTITSNGTLVTALGGTIGAANWSPASCSTTARWTSPWTITTGGANFGMVPSNTGLNGSYVYKTTITSSSPCNIINATLNFSALGADNEITSIKVNGTTYALGSAYTHAFLNPYNQNVTAAVVNGTNTIEVNVTNYTTSNSYTGLFLCGSLTITRETPITTPNFTNASIFCQGDPLIFNGASSIGTFNNHFWEIVECTSGGSPIGTAWNQWFVGSPGTINFSNYSLGFIPSCGKYYRIKLAGSNSCDGNIWHEFSKVIYINCPPNLQATTPAPNCQGNSFTLTASGATSYNWQPGNSSASSITVTPSTTTTYTVTGTSSNGCTASLPVVVTVAPLNLDIDLSTGVNNTNGSLIGNGQPDDTWKVRAIPGTYNPSSFTSLQYSTVVGPVTASPPSTGYWATSPNEKWISVNANGSGNAQQLPASLTTGDVVAQDYIYEAEFTLLTNYSNLRIELTELSVDNGIELYLNPVVVGPFNSYDYTVSREYAKSAFGIGAGDNNFNTIHNPGTIATTQSEYIVGTNKVDLKIYNGGGAYGWNGSYTGIQLNAHVKGTCVSRRNYEIIPTYETQLVETIASIFPNPTTGSFTITTGEQNITTILVKDAISRTIKTLNNVNTTSANIDLSNEQKGIYFVEITIEGEMKPVFKKVIVQ